VPKGVEVQVLSSAYETEKNPRVFGDFVFIAQILKISFKNLWDRSTDDQAATRYGTFRLSKFRDVNGYQLVTFQIGRASCRERV